MGFQFAPHEESLAQGIENCFCHNTKILQRRSVRVGLALSFWPWLISAQSPALASTLVYETLINGTSSQRKNKVNNEAYFRRQSVISPECWKVSFASLSLLSIAPKLASTRIFLFIFFFKYVSRLFKVNWAARWLWQSAQDKAQISLHGRYTHKNYAVQPWKKLRVTRWNFTTPKHSLLKYCYVTGMPKGAETLFYATNCPTCSRP